MKSQDLDKALAIARSDRSLGLADLAIFDGFGLPDFRPVTCTIEALAMLVRWQCIRFDGSVDSEALQEIATLGRAPVYGAGRKGGGVMNVYARVTSDGYLLYAATDGDYTGSDRYWPDYYSGDFPDGDVDTLLLADVPAEFAHDLCEQGGSGQVFGDGYDAWQAALPYSKYGKAVA